MSKPPSQNVIGQLFDSGDVYKADAETLKSIMQGIAALDVRDATILNRALIRAQVVNQLQMAKVLEAMEKRNDCTQKLVIALAVIAILVGGFQALIALVQLCAEYST